LNGSAQVKVPSHYISSQILAPPGPASSLSRPAVPTESKASTSSSDGGPNSPTSPSKFPQNSLFIYYKYTQNAYVFMLCFNLYKLNGSGAEVTQPDGCNLTLRSSACFLSFVLSKAIKNMKKTRLAN
ncbi:hypothetical protein ILYODFUR_028680, partial [Ilyodon furcidens]